jgi:thioredoxin reductase
MEMLLTTAAFLAITFVAIRLHLGSKARASAARSTAGGAVCPRCRAVVKAGASTCGACGVPLSAFEIVSAPAASSRDGAAGAGALHAIVRDDVCVGCGLCVPVCPEPGAIAMVGKRAVVDLHLCKGHGNCVEACPVAGIFLSTGDAVQRLEVPEVDVHFESNVPGLYIVGELGGRGLIKNAINEGKIAIEHVTAQVLHEKDSVPVDPGVLDVLVVGSGPAGLAAGLEAKRVNLSYAVLERGTVADTIRKYPRHKLLLAEPVRMPLYGDLWVADASKESLIHVWEAIIAETGLDVLTGHEVTRVERSGEIFFVEAGDLVFRARRVVLAMGRRGIPRRLEVKGEDLSKVVYDVAEMEVFRGRRVVVVGGGDSAVESALGLANQPGTDVTLSYRGDRFERAKERNQTKLDAAVRGGKVRLLLRSQVLEIRHDAVVFDVAGKQAQVPNDDVIIRIGGEPPRTFLDRTGVHTIHKNVPMAPATDEAAT